MFTTLFCHIYVYMYMLYPHGLYCLLEFSNKPYLSISISKRFFFIILFFDKNVTDTTYIYIFKHSLKHYLHMVVICLFCLFVFVALRPKSTAMVMAKRSVHLTTLFPGQA